MGTHLSCHFYKNDVLVEKKCNKCNKWLKPNMFPKKSSTKSGYYPFCNMCKSAEDKKYRSNSKSKHKKNRGTKVFLDCAHCGNKFETYTSQVKRRKYCSKECVSSDSIKVPLICICGISFYISPSETQKRNRQCCSLECRSKLRFLKSHKCDRDGNVKYKKCPKCERWLSRDFFSSNANSRSGLSSQCIECYKVSRKLKVYNITKEKYDSLSQNCEACGSQENLNIDHCHDSGIVRGMLCTQCNTALGLLKEDPMRITNLLRYIEDKSILISD